MIAETCHLKATDLSVKTFFMLSDTVVLVSCNVCSFHVDVACNTNASDVCEIKLTYLLTCICHDLVL